MLAFPDPHDPSPPGLARREWLRLGGLGAFGLSASGWARGRRCAAESTDARLLSGRASFGRARSCIVLFLCGGPPQHETWDPKPQAPAEVRGPFVPIATSVPGIDVCELMPRTATLVEHIAVLRAMSTQDNAHSSSGYWMLTGVPHAPTNAENTRPGFPNNWPSVSAIVNHLRPTAGPLPSAVTLPEHLWNTGGITWPGQDGGWLGRAADPWLLTCDPQASDFQVPGLGVPADIAPRFASRRTLLAEFNHRLEQLATSPVVSRWDQLDHQSFDLLSSPVAQRAFQLDQETPAVRERYGRNRFGQSVLLARRLIEAGVSLVQVNWTRATEDSAVNPMWDTHADNAGRMKNALMPVMDLAYSALLEDLAQRGLLEETLVVQMGEFGRTPRISSNGGRDHWGHVFSVALAGGGVQGGQVVGASDPLGAYPRSGRVEPQDLAATVLHCLGHAPQRELHDHLGRPSPISRGEPIAALVG